MKAAMLFVLMRGGTSKGVFFREEDVPSDRGELSAFLLDVFGSPDRRQIDGLGGADMLTSKAVIIGRPVISETDVIYLYGHVGIVVADVDFRRAGTRQHADSGAHEAADEGVPDVDRVGRYREIVRNEM